jgi:hypothetical protein
LKEGGETLALDDVAVAEDEGALAAAAGAPFAAALPAGAGAAAEAGAGVDACSALIANFAMIRSMAASGPLFRLTDQMSDIDWLAKHDLPSVWVVSSHVHNIVCDT